MACRLLRRADVVFATTQPDPEELNQRKKNDRRGRVEQGEQGGVEMKEDQQVQLLHYTLGVGRKGWKKGCTQYLYYSSCNPQNTSALP